MFLPCRRCCAPKTCELTDKPYQDTATATRYFPTSGSWATSVNWTTATSGDEVFYFSGHASGGGYSGSGFDLLNPCNWYSVATTTPPGVQASPSSTLTHRATRLPGENDIVHLYDYNPGAVGFAAAIATSSVKYKSVYCWAQYFGATILLSGNITTSTAVYDGDGCSLLNAGFNLEGVYNGPGVKMIYSRARASAGDFRVNGFVYLYGGSFIQGVSGTERLVTGDLYLNDSSYIAGPAKIPRPTSPQSDTPTFEGVVTANDTSYVSNNVYCKGGLEMYDSSAAYDNAGYNDQGPFISKTIDMNGSSYLGEGARAYGILDWIRLYDTSEMRDDSKVDAGNNAVEFYNSSRYRSTAFGVPNIPQGVGAVFNDDSGSNYTAAIAGYGTAYCLRDQPGLSGVDYLPTCNTTAPTYAADPTAARGCG